MTALATPVELDTKTAFPSLVNPADSKSEEGTFSGRIVTEIRDFFVGLGNGLAEGARKIAVYVGQLFRDCCSLARVCRLGINAFSVIEKCVGMPGMFTAISSQLGAAESLIYTVSVGDQINYFGTGKQNEESILSSIGNGALLAAGIGGVFVLLGEVALLSFSKISEAIGSVPVFGAVTQLGIGFSQIISSVAAAGFLMFACDAASKLANAETTEKRVQALLDLAWHVTELALAVFVTVCNDWIGVLVLGTVAAGLGIASFIYSRHVEAEEAEKKQTLKLV